jgi:glucose 1-dehydrogenase
MQADVGVEAQVVDLIGRTVAEFGGLDILVNNAGIEEYAPILELPLDMWGRVVRTNLTGAFLCLREAAKVMAAGTGGVVVNVSSIHEYDPWPGYAHYCASKAGWKLLMQTAARELAARQIRVVNVAPGAIETPINQTFWTTRVHSTS